MDTAPAIAQFLDSRSRRIAPDSLKLYTRMLETWRSWRSARDAPPELSAIDLSELDRFFVYLAADHVPHHNNPRRPAPARRGLAPESIAGYRRVMRAFWRFAGARGWLQPDQRSYFSREGIEPIPVPELPRPVYDESTFAELLAAAGDGQHEESARDRAILALLWESGARISEILSMDDQHADIIRRRASIVGKGKRVRVIRWGPIAQIEILRYLQRRQGSQKGPLLRATGRNAGERISPDVARSRIKRIAELAGVELAPGSPLHAFRRSWIQRGIDDGLDISDVSQLAGHSSIETTMRYARRDEERLQEIYESGYIRRDRRRRRE